MSAWPQRPVATRATSVQVAYRAKPEDAAVQRGIVRRIAARARLRGCQRAPRRAARIHDDRPTPTSTSIVVRYRPHEDIRLLSAVLRGLMYHEGGHCPLDAARSPRCAKQSRTPTSPTPPTHDAEPIDRLAPRLQRAWNGLEDQRMETAVISDSPRKAAYLTPMIMTELTDTPEAAVANWPLLIWRRYLPRKMRAAARRGLRR